MAIINLMWLLNKTRRRLAGMCTRPKLLETETRPRPRPRDRDETETFAYLSETRPRPRPSLSETRPRSRLGHLRLKDYNGCVTRGSSKCMMQFEFSVFCLLVRVCF